MRIFVSRQIPGTGILEKLTLAGHEVTISEFDRPLTAAEFIEGARGSDAVLTLLTDKIDGEVIDAIGPQLKIISNYAVGFDNINVEELTAKGVVVTNTPSDEVNESVAEMAWTMMLALAKRLVEADESTRRGAYKGWEPGIFLGVNMVGKTLGILGLGRIGAMTARRAAGFNMNVIYFNRSRDEKLEAELGIMEATGIFFNLLNSKKTDLLLILDYLRLNVTEKTENKIIASLFNNWLKDKTDGYQNYSVFLKAYNFFLTESGEKEVFYNSKIKCIFFCSIYFKKRPMDYIKRT